MLTKDDDSDVDRTQYTEFIRLFEQAILTLSMVDQGERRMYENKRLPSLFTSQK